MLHCSTAPVSIPGQVERSSSAPWIKILRGARGHRGRTCLAQKRTLFLARCPTRMTLDENVVSCPILGRKFYLRGSLMDLTNAQRQALFRQRRALLENTAPRAVLAKAVTAALIAKHGRRR